MPQEHYVLRCFSCETFQVHIVKKAKKWECKMCGAKQSVKRNYGKGSGKDCRNQVMKLNELRLINDCNLAEPESSENKTSNSSIRYQEDDCIWDEFKEESHPNQPHTSKWGKYLDEPTKDSESEVEDSITDFFNKAEDKTKKRVKKMSEHYSSKSKKICRDSDTNDVSYTVLDELLSPPSKDNKAESCENYEKTKKNCCIETKNKLKSSKYAKYLDDDDNDGDDVSEDIKNKKEKDVTLPNIFDSIYSNPNDLEDMLSLE